MSAENIIAFPVRAPAELELCGKLKEVTYEFAGRLTLCQIIGIFAVAVEEIREEQP